MFKTLEEVRDGLLRNLKEDEKNPERRFGYVDGVLDMYNEAKQTQDKDKKEEVK